MSFNWCCLWKLYGEDAYCIDFASELRRLVYAVFSIKWVQNSVKCIKVVEVLPSSVAKMLIP